MQNGGVIISKTDSWGQGNGTAKSSKSAIPGEHSCLHILITIFSASYLHPITHLARIFLPHNILQLCNLMSSVSNKMEKQCYFNTYFNIPSRIRDTSKKIFSFDFSGKKKITCLYLGRRKISPMKNHASELLFRSHSLLFWHVQPHV